MAAASVQGAIVPTIPSTASSTGEAPNSLAGLGNLSALPKDILAQFLSAGLSPQAIVLAQEIVASSRQGDSVFSSMNEISELRKAIDERVADLGALKAFVGTAAAGQPDVPVTVDWAKFKAQHPKIAARYPGGAGEMTQAMSFSLKDGKVVCEKSGSLGDTIGSGEVTVTARQLTAATERHTGALQDLDSAKELTLMRLQTSVQSKQRLITTFSNVADSEHRRKDSVVKNIRV